MTRTIFKYFIDYEKEEIWLNQMASIGLAMTHFVLGFYTFTDCVPGEYIYRLELLKNYPGNIESQRYIRFMEENGVEAIATWYCWVYFRKKAEDGSFDIYSDIDSRITHYKRISIFMFCMMISQYCFAVSQILTFTFLCIPFLFLGTILFLYWNSLRIKINILKNEKKLRD